MEVNYSKQYQIKMAAFTSTTIKLPCTRELISTDERVKELVDEVSKMIEFDKITDLSLGENDNI